MREICRICLERDADSFEHVPPRKAFNDEPSRRYTLADWFAREEGGLAAGHLEQRGAGGAVLCQRCNNNTGSWYGSELVHAARAGARILAESPLDQLDESLEPSYINVKFTQQANVGPHPLRLIKQIVAMLLATSQPEFSQANPQLGQFVLEKERTGLEARYQLYLALFAGPNARTTGLAVRVGILAGHTLPLIEVAYPPFAYVLTIDAAPGAIETANITAMAEVGYRQRADLDLDLLVGFGHTPYPADYRTRAMVDREAAL